MCFQAVPTYLGTLNILVGCMSVSTLVTLTFDPYFTIMVLLLDICTYKKVSVGSQVVMWSDGQVVMWSGGQVVRWSGGQVARWSGGQVVR